MQGCISKAEDLGIQLGRGRVVLPTIHDPSDGESEEEDFVAVNDDGSVESQAIQEGSSAEPKGKHSSAGFQRVFSEHVDISICAAEEETNPEVDPEKMKEIDPKRAGMNHLHSKKEELLARAPIVPYGADLDYWDKTDIPFNSSGLEFQHRFLGAGTGERQLSNDAVAHLKRRLIVLDPEEKPKDIQVSFRN